MRINDSDFGAASRQTDRRSCRLDRIHPAAEASVDATRSRLDALIAAFSPFTSRPKVEWLVERRPARPSRRDRSRSSQRRRWIRTRNVRLRRSEHAGTGLRRKRLLSASDFGSYEKQPSPLRFAQLSNFYNNFPPTSTDSVPDTGVIVNCCV